MEWYQCRNLPDKRENHLHSEEHDRKHNEHARHTRHHHHEESDDLWRNHGSTSSSTAWAKGGKWQSPRSKRRRQSRLNIRHECVLVLGFDRHWHQVEEKHEAAMTQRGETAHEHTKAKTLSQNGYRPAHVFC